MGSILKLAVAGAVSVYSIRSVVRVNQLVKQVNVPNHTLLGKYNSQPSSTLKQYKDAYKIELPARFKLLKNTGSANELYVHDFARHFFTCKIFSNLEKPILLNLLKLTDKNFIPDDSVLEFRAFRFQVDDQVLVWKVISREKNEILMKWEFKGISGTTWFYIPKDENVLVFGSSILMPKEMITVMRDKVTKKEPKQLYIDAARTLPQDASIVDKMKSLVLRTFNTVTISVHQLYSKYLLLSTYNKIISQDTLDKRKPESYA